MQIALFNGTRPRRAIRPTHDSLSIHLVFTEGAFISAPSKRNKFAIAVLFTIKDVALEVITTWEDLTNTSHQSAVMPVTHVHTASGMNPYATAILHTVDLFTFVPRTLFVLSG